MLGRLITISTVVASVVLLLVVQTTTPSTIGPVGLLAVFFLFYVIMLGLITVFLWLSARLLSRISKPFTTKRPLGSLTLQRSYYFSSVVALAPVMMLAMQSIGSLGVYEFILILVFLGVGILYVAKRTH